MQNHQPWAGIAGTIGPGGFVPKGGIGFQSRSLLQPLQLLPCNDLRREMSIYFLFNCDVVGWGIISFVSSSEELSAR